MAIYISIYANSWECHRSVFYLRQGYVFASACLSVRSITQNTDQILMRFYGMDGHNSGTSRLDFK